MRLTTKTGAFTIALLGCACLFAPAAPAALTVTKPADTNDGVCDADCSLREAIDKAAPGETVVVPASATPYQVADPNSLALEKNLTVEGAGARSTTVTGTGTVARVFTVRSAAGVTPNVTIRGLTISAGNGSGNGFGGTGGGVLAVRTGAAADGPKLTLEAVRVTGNIASVGPGFVAVGGGIAADGVGTVVTVRDSLVDGNKAIGMPGGAEGAGGGIAAWSSGALTLENVTVTGNEARGSTTLFAAGHAGGVLATNGSTLTNLTIHSNRTESTGPGAMPSRAGNVELSGSVTVRNTIVSGGEADVAASGDCSGEFVSTGGNILGEGCKLGAADLGADPLLAALADNGGGTDTLALMSGSPALDFGVGCPPPAADQRGLPRPSGAGCDSGAYEHQYLPPSQPISSPQPSAPQRRSPAAICRREKATIVGTSGPDRLKGTEGPDVIAGLAGGDTLVGRGGRDVICGGKGADTIRGGKGPDHLLGQKGADRLRGGPGKDRLAGGKGRDSEQQ